MKAAMKKVVALGLGSLICLCSSWSGPARQAQDARPSGADFAALRMHLEVDLPARSGKAVLPASMLQLPAEVVLELESELPLRRIRLLDGAGRTVLQLDCPQAGALGIAEFALESEGASLAEVLDEYPPGEYAVEATCVDGRALAGRARLGSTLPGWFAVSSPLPGEVVDREQLTLSWTPARNAARYMLEIEQEELGFGFETWLPAGQTSFKVPAELLQRGVTYDYSLTVQGDTDNELEIEGRFVTRGTGALRPQAAAR